MAPALNTPPSYRGDVPWPIRLMASAGGGNRPDGPLDETAQGESPALSGRKILVVEDEPVMRLVTEKILENAGYKVRQAADGLEAVEIFRRDPDGYQAVILDIVMPRLDGRETLALLRRLRPELPVLVISGQPKDLALEGIREGRLLRFVGKPFLPKDLVADFQRLLLEAAEPDA